MRSVLKEISSTEYREISCHISYKKKLPQSLNDRGNESRARARRWQKERGRESITEGRNPNFASTSKP